jgi:hypothetical protein
MAGGASKCTIGDVRQKRKAFQSSKKWQNQTVYLCNLWRDNVKSLLSDLDKAVFLMNKNCGAYQASKKRTSYKRQQWKGKQAQYNWRMKHGRKYC